MKITSKLQATADMLRAKLMTVTEYWLNDSDWESLIKEASGLTNKDLTEPVNSINYRGTLVIRFPEIGADRSKSIVSRAMDFTSMFGGDRPSERYVRIELETPDESYESDYSGRQEF